MAFSRGLVRVYLQSSIYLGLSSLVGAAQFFCTQAHSDWKPDMHNTLLTQQKLVTPETHLAGTAILHVGP